MATHVVAAASTMDAAAMGDWHEAGALHGEAFQDPLQRNHVPAAHDGGQHAKLRPRHLRNSKHGRKGCAMTASYRRSVIQLRYTGIQTRPACP